MSSPIDARLESDVRDGIHKLNLALGRAARSGIVYKIAIAPTTSEYGRLDMVRLDQWGRSTGRPSTQR